MGYAAATPSATIRDWSQWLSWKISALVRHVTTSHQVIGAVAFLYFWGGSGFLGSLVEMLLVLDLLECWFTTEDKLDLPKDWKILIVGSGFSGLGQAKRLLDAGVTNFTILEKSSRLGGTWNHNRYPGVACDVPSHLYSFSFMQNPWWSRHYSGGTEIQQYLSDVVEKFGIKKYIRFNQEVQTARWDETTKTWTVETKGGEIHTANIVFSCTGPFPKPFIPDFKNMDKFDGKALHSAEWDPTLDVKGKKVAVIGTGASSVQITPEIADRVQELTVFQRTPAWVPTRFNNIHSKPFQYLMFLFPWMNKVLRFFIFWRNELMFHGGFKEDGFMKDFIDRGMRKMMKNHLPDRPDLHEKLIPKFRYGCKRITPNDDYLNAFTKPNVKLVQETIEEFTPKGIKTKDGKEHQFDIIILATGFDMLACLFPVYGRNQEKPVGEIWDDEPRCYVGTVTPEMPNLFFVMGPGSGLGHSSVVYVAECQITYNMDALRKLVNAHNTDEDIKSMRLKDKVLTEYIEETERAMKNVAFGGASCPQAWYRNNRGVNWTLYPKDLVSFWWETRKAQWQDYIFQ